MGTATLHPSPTSNTNSIIPAASRSFAKSGIPSSIGSCARWNSDQPPSR